MDGNGNLDMSELKDIMKNPQFVSTAMEHLDLNLDGCVSLREWLISMKLTCDKSEAACKTALKMHEKGDARHQPEPARRPNSSAAFLAASAAPATCGAHAIDCVACSRRPLRPLQPLLWPRRRRSRRKAEYAPSGDMLGRIPVASASGTSTEYCSTSGGMMDRECARTDCARSHTPSEHGDGRASPFSSFTDTSIVLCVLERVHLGIGGTLDMCMRVTVKMALLAFCGPGKFRNGRARAPAARRRV